MFFTQKGNFSSSAIVSKLLSLLCDASVFLLPAKLIFSTITTYDVCCLPSEPVYLLDCMLPHIAIISPFEKYFSKGDMIAICGSIQSNRYTGSDGKQHTSYVVMVENISFAGSKKTEASQSKDNNFETIAEDEKLPF